MPCPQLVHQLLYRDYGAASISSAMGEAIRAHARAMELAEELGFESAPSSPVMSPMKSPMVPALSDTEDEDASDASPSPPRKKKRVHMPEPEVGLHPILNTKQERGIPPGIPLEIQLHSTLLMGTSSSPLRRRSMALLLRKEQVYTASSARHQHMIQA
ncbi:hypothetical protein PG995_007032 [Apiospora arundinis]